jgi:MFS family permease
MTVMAGALIAPALPDMQRVLARNEGDALLVRLVLTLPALLTALFAPIAGWLVDRAGRRRLLLGGMALYLVSGSSGLYLNTLSQLLVGRACLGVAIACIITSTVTLVADLFTSQERERFLGVQSAFMGMTAMLFLSTGGWLAEQHWRTPFAIYLLPIVMMWMAARHIPETLQQVVAAAIVEHHTSVRIAWFRVVVIYACGLLGMLLFYLIPVQLPFYLQMLTEGVASRAGIAIGCSTVVGALTALQYRRVRQVFGYRSIFAVMFAVIGVSFVLLARAQTYATVVAALAFGGIGFGMLVPNATVWVSSLAPELLRGRLIGGLMTCFFVGQFLSPLAAQPVLTRTGLGGWQGVYASAGYLSMAVALAFFVAGPLWKRAR